MQTSSTIEERSPGSSARFEAGAVEKKRLKVVHMTSVHTPLDPRIFHKECRSLAKAGFDVTVIGANWQEGERDRVRIQSVRSHATRFGRMTQAPWHIYRQAIALDADVYHFHDPELILVGLLLRARGKSVIYDIHEDMPKEILSKHYLPIWSRALVSWVVAQIENAACGRFSGLVVVTPSIAARFRRLNSRTVIVHNYPYVRELVREGQAIPWEQRRQSVAYVGGITRQRAAREMVQAMALLPSSLPATLELAGPLVAGDISLDELSREQGWQRVENHGFIDQRSTFRILQNVRVGLVLYHPEPNQIESLPQKIFEYMGAGIPVIASDFPFWRSILEKAGCGLFVDPLQPAQIARAIEFLLSHPRQAEEMGQRGQAAVLKHFNWDTEAEKLIQLYSALKN